MPFADEVSGAAAATAGAIRGTINTILGTELSTEGMNYAEGKAREEASRAKYAEENPGKSAAATGLSALATMGRGGAGVPVGVLPIAKEGAKQGAVIGGLYGAGEGEGLDRIKNAFIGAGEGAAFGAAIPAAVSGVGALYRGGKALLSPATTAVANRLTPEARATKLAAEAFRRDGVPLDQAGQRVGAMQRTSPETVLADVGGENVRGLARVTVNTPGAGRERVAAFMEARRLDQPERIVNSIRSVLKNPDDFAKTTARMAAERERIAGPIYQSAFSKSVPVNVTGVVRKIDQTVRPGVNAMVSPGSDLRPDGIAATLGRLRSYFATQQNQRVDLRELHNIKMELDDMIGAAKAAGEGTKARALKDVQRELLRSMDRASPDYKKARSIYSSSHEMDEALDLGRNVFRMDADALKAELSRMDTPAQREMVQVGIARAVEDMAMQTRDGHDLVRRMFGNKKSRDVLRAGFQNDKAFRQFQVTMMREAAMRRTDDAIRGNSTTARQLADLMETHQGGVGRDVISLVMDGKFGQAAAAGVRQAIMGEQGISAQVADKLSKLLLSNDPAQIQRAMTALARKEKALERVKAALTNFGRTGGQLLTREYVASQSR